MLHKALLTLSGVVHVDAQLMLLLVVAFLLLLVRLSKFQV